MAHMRASRGWRLRCLGPLNTFASRSFSEREKFTTEGRQMMLVLADADTTGRNASPENALAPRHQHSINLEFSK